MEPQKAAKVFSVVAKAIRHTFRGTVIFRTNVMGHNNCEEFSEPSSDAIHRASKYNWANFTLYNQAVVGAFNGVVKRFEVIDLSMYELRGDGHVTYGDCLHYCTPGPPDHWNHLLYHILRRRSD